MNKTIGSWYLIYICSHCHKRLYKASAFGHDDIYDNDGMCKHCGHQRGSVCDYRKLSVRKNHYLRPDREWFEFWKSKCIKFEYEGKDSFTQEWLDSQD